jgi:hypothetical protein
MNVAARSCWVLLVLAGCNSTAGPAPVTSGSGVPACHWPASLDAMDAGNNRCTARRHRLKCDAGDAGAFAGCISDDATRCAGLEAIPNVTFTCHDECSPGEFGVVCGGIGPLGPSSEPPSLDCRLPAHTPGGISFYCCPCGS